jgi:hypothetical protein
MEYYVVMPDGSKYGPATLDTLNEWAQQGRILPTTTIERVSDGVQGPASMVPGLILPSSGGPAAPAPGNPAPPSFGQPASPQAPGYGEADPGLYSGYPRQQQYSYDQVPYELQGKFNWGAFLLTWIWGLNHKAYITLIRLGLGAIQFFIGFLTRPDTSALTPGTNPMASQGFNPLGILFTLAGLGLAVFYGIKGYEWAWQSGRFATPEECRRCQTIWGWWGLGFILFTCVCCAVAAIGGVLAVAGAAGTMR